MKKFLSILLVLNAALLAGVLLRENEAVVEAAPGGVPSGNGDVNGDGGLDIADAVYIINYQFFGGPAPVPIECPPPAAKGLPATGQTKCYDSAGDVIDCASADFPGEDGFYQDGCPREGRFIDHGNGTVTDTCTGLMWQREIVSGVFDWQAALTYCERLDLAGNTDWRLPNMRELHSLVDYGRIPAIDPIFGTLPHGCWSSTTVHNSTQYGWTQDFSQGWSGSGPHDGIMAIRAVRTVK